MGSKLSNEEAPVDENSNMSKRHIAPTSSQESEKKRLSMKHEVADKLEMAAAEVGRKQVLLDQATQRASAAQDALEQLESEWPEEYQQLLTLLEKHEQALRAGNVSKAAETERLIDALEESGVDTLIVKWRKLRAKVDKLAAAEERANAAWGKAMDYLTAL
jgi:septal ring factor EnvC (AmiA/AmiB activator)